jgi:hypothetical protein
VSFWSGQKDKSNNHWNEQTNKQIMEIASTESMIAPRQQKNI